MVFWVLNNSPELLKAFKISEQHAKLMFLFDTLGLIRFSQFVNTLLPKVLRISWMFYSSGSFITKCILSWKNQVNICLAITLIFVCHDGQKIDLNWKVYPVNLSFGKLKLRKLNFAGYRLLHSLDSVPYSWHQPCILLVYDLPFAFVFIKQGNISHRTAFILINIQ